MNLAEHRAKGQQSSLQDKELCMHKVLRKHSSCSRWSSGTIQIEVGCTTYHAPRAPNHNWRLLHCWRSQRRMKNYPRTMCSCFLSSLAGAVLFSVLAGWWPFVTLLRTDRSAESAEMAFGSIKDLNGSFSQCVAEWTKLWNDKTSTHSVQPVAQR